jgi:uncharacterized protein (TIGR00661 family)
LPAKRKIIVAPLNWGLGHATRCVPIIHLLIEQGFEVLLASDGDALQLLQLEFPKLTSFELPSYNIEYGHHFAFSVLKRVPHILSTIKRERQAIETIAKNTGAEIIISDNRYGCYTSFTKNIFVCHQHYLLVPVFSDLANSLHRKLLRKFEQHWIPDREETETKLGGQLSTSNLHSVSYIGPLSRFQKMETAKKYDCIAVISGPEPQRSYFEAIIKEQFSASALKTLLVCGKATEASTEKHIGNCTIVPFLNAVQLNQAICASDVVICRSGYSSVMDLATLEKKVIFIPTPGQTEQIYLAEYFQQKNIAPCYKQSNFELNSALMEVKKYSGFHSFEGKNNLRTIIAQL